MPMIMSAKAFKKQIYDVHNVEVTLPADVEKVILKNDSILKNKMPKNWTLEEFKQYLKGFVKQYVYDEVKKNEAERALLRNIEKSKSTGRSKGNKSDRKSLTLSSVEI